MLQALCVVALVRSQTSSGDGDGDLVPEFSSSVQLVFSSSEAALPPSSSSLGMPTPSSSRPSGTYVCNVHALHSYAE